MLIFLGLALLATVGITPTSAAPPAFQATALVSVDRLVPGQEFRLAVVLELPAPWHVNAHPASLPDLIPTDLTWEPVPGLELGPVVYPAGEPVTVTWADQPVRLYSERVVLFATGWVRADAPAVAAVLRGALRFQACDDNVCVAPRTIAVEVASRIAVTGEAALPLQAAVFGAAPPAALGGAVAPASGAAPAPEANRIAALVAQRGWTIALVVVFLGGLALNLTPCVYPMLAITVSYFGGQGERGVGRAFAGALAYCLGIVVTYSTLGLVAALTGGLFGAWLQSPVVLLAIAALLVVMALSMFGLFELRPPSFLVQRATGMSGRAGWLGTFLLGATVGVVAAPCLAPILVALLAFVGQRGDPWLGWWLFFVLASGLGLPYVVLGTFSGLLARMPRSGAWMVWVKRVFGVLLVLVAFWFVRPLLHRDSAGPSLLAWQPYSPAAVAGAERPVLIDFSADWCIPCREMEKSTFRDPRVVDRSTRFLLLRADLTRTGSAVVEKLTRDFRIVGVPTTVLLDRAGHEHGDLRQVGYVGPDEFVRVLDDALQRGTAATNARPDATTADPAQAIPPALLRKF